MRPPKNSQKYLENKQRIWDVITSVGRLLKNHPDINQESGGGSI
jgi:hypothetical protein